jgi:integrase
MALKQTKPNPVQLDMLNESPLFAKSNPKAIEQMDMLEQYKPGDDGGAVVKRVYSRESGMGRTTLRSIEKAYPDDPLRQASEFFFRFKIPAGTGHARIAGIQTHQEYTKHLKSTIRALFTLNMKIKNLSELSKRQVEAVHKLWEADGQGAGIMANKNTVLRRLGIWIGKPDLCSHLPDLLTDKDRARRTYTALTAKSLSARNIDPEDVFRDMDALCPIAGLQLRLQYEFGLRVKETVMFRPFAADQGTSLYVRDGAKGGNSRMVPFHPKREKEQRQLIDDCKAVAQTNVKGILSDQPKRSLVKSMTRYYYLCRRIGLTKNDLGVTSHSFRHEFANDKFFDLTGTDSAVNGGEKLPKKVDLAARLAVSKVMGHHRPYVTSAYIGNHVTLERHHRTAIKALIEKLESCAELKALIDEKGITRLWVVGPEADGVNTSPVMMITSLGADGGETLVDDANAIANLVGRVMGRRPCVHIPYAAYLSQNLPSLELMGLTPDWPAITTGMVKISDTQGLPAQAAALHLPPASDSSIAAPN